MSGIISNAGQMEQAAIVREQTLKDLITELKEMIVALGKICQCYRNQHDAGYKNSHCTCVNCVFATQLFERVVKLLNKSLGVV